MSILPLLATLRERNPGAMYFDDFIAQQTMKTINTPHRGYPAAGAPGRRLLGALWRGVRQVAWGIDAFSRIRHGLDVPPEHGARNHREQRPEAPRR